MIFRRLQEERGVAALMTVAFLSVLGGLVIALMLASARVNDAYTLLYSAAQSAAYSAATTADLGGSGEVQIPCDDDPLGDVRGTPSRCENGLALGAALQVLRPIFRGKPSGFCLADYNCTTGGRPVYMRVEEGSSTSLQIFNTDFNPEIAQTKCYDQVLGSSGGALPIPAGQDGILDSGGRFICWGLREDLGRSEPTMHSVQYASGVVVRLDTEVDIFAFRDRPTSVAASASIGQGE